MKKHLWSVLLALVFLLVVLSGVQAKAATVSGDWEYDITDDGDASIVAYHGTETDIVIPDTLDGLTVVRIANEAFQNRSNLRNISFPESLISIGQYAFQGCTNLKSLTLPLNLEKVGFCAFGDCYDLESITVNSISLSNFEGTYPSNCFDNAGISSKNGITVTFSDTVKRVPACMFYVTGYGSGSPNISSVTIGRNVTTIAYNAFCGCTSLREVVIPEDSALKTIASEAFSGCSKLQGILLPLNLETIGYCAFENCSNLESIMVHSAKLSKCESSSGFASDCFENAGTSSKNGITVVFSDSVTKIPANMFYGGSPNIRNVTIGKNVKSIGYNAFAYCSNLKEVVIPEDSEITYIGESAFEGCTNLRSILLPEKLETLYYGAFQNCVSMESITVHSVNLNHLEEKSCFSNAGKSAKNGIAVIFSDTVTRIPARLFAVSYGSNPDIRSVTIGNSVKVIGVSAFAGCSNLSEIIMPETAPIQTIGASAFSGCSSLPGIVLTDALTSIGSGAFSGCSSLRQLDIYNYFCEVSMDPGTLGDPEVTVVRGYGGSAAHQFAQKHGHRFYSYISRIYGAHRYETSMVVADQMKDNLGLEKFDSVILATGNNFADALSGSYLANVKTAPILLTSGIEWVDDIIEDYVRDNVEPGGTVYILGDTSAVPSTFDTNLDGFEIKRLAGKNRFDTNLMILEEAGIDDEPILVCTGLGFADSLSASASRLPILLVWNSLTEDQHTFLEGLNGNELYIIGGPTAVNETVETELTAYGEPTRLGGKNRFETSVLLAEQFFENPDTIVLAYAWNFPDGLCGGPLAVTLNAPLILTMDRYEIRAADYVQDYDPKYGIILGGTSLVSDHTVQNIYHFDSTATFPKN